MLSIMLNRAMLERQMEARHLHRVTLLRHRHLRAHLRRKYWASYAPCDRLLAHLWYGICF